MDRRLVTIGALVLAVTLFPCLASAEVMDKEPTLLSLWSSALLLGVVGFFAWRRHVTLGAIAGLAAAVLVWSFHLELTDPHVGPAILQEAGRGYVLQAYAAILVCAALHLAGIAAFVRQRHATAVAVLHGP